MQEALLFSRGIGVGLILLMCLKLWLDYSGMLAGRLLMALMVGLAGYLMLPLVAGSWLKHVLVLPAILVPPIFWLFTQAVFYDWDKLGVHVGKIRLGLVLLFAMVAYGGYLLELFSSAQPTLFELGLFYLSYLLRFVFILLALAAILNQWSQDLVASRRRLRTMMVAVGGGYMFVVVFVEVILKGGLAPLWLEVVHSLLLVSLLMAVAAWLLLLAPNGLLNTIGMDKRNQDKKPAVAAVSELEKAVLSVSEKKWLDALQHAMTVEQVYHNCELSIGRLGDMLTIPEHQLRRLINQHLGYRNFNEYLNHFRIQEASTQLGSADFERLPILTIALDVGYASLTPFNRAFKTCHQQTPSEYRREKLANNEG